MAKGVLGVMGTPLALMTKSKAVSCAICQCWTLVSCMQNTCLGDCQSLPLIGLAATVVSWDMDLVTGTKVDVHCSDPKLF